MHSNTLRIEPESWFDHMKQIMHNIPSEIPKLLESELANVDQDSR